MIALTGNVKKYLPGTVLLCLLSFFSGHVGAVHSVLWDRTVIRLNLSVGVEQVVYFPSDAAVGLPPTLADTSFFRTLSAGKTVYWKALQPFSGERVQVRLSSGEFVLFDITANVDKQPPAQADPINIVFSKPGDSGGAPRGDERGNDKNEANLFDLVRYAAQSVYAPRRLLAPLHGIKEVPIGIAGSVNRLYQASKDAGRSQYDLVLMPLKSWRLKGLYVTAIAVKNKSAQMVSLDNRHLQHTRDSSINGVSNHFIASSFYRRTLSPTGEKGDRTTLFIVTDRPFAASLRL